jgi:hypothetical protein
LDRDPEGGRLYLGVLGWNPAYLPRRGEETGRLIWCNFDLDGWQPCTGR